MANRLFLGNRRYSSWSLRGWLAVRLAELGVEDVVIPMAAADTPAIREVTPAGLVPYLEHDGARVWETLAICEYCAELRPSLWPADRVARAAARSAASEMHAGFRALRTAMPMNLGREAPLAGGVAPDVRHDIDRIEALWRELRAPHSGPYLFGPEMGAADAMFAPVAARFLSYRPELSPASQAYCDAVRSHPLVARWYELAAQEPAAWQMAKYESLS